MTLATASPSPLATHPPTRFLSYFSHLVFQLRTTAILCVYELFTVFMGLVILLHLNSVTKVLLYMKRKKPFQELWCKKTQLEWSDIWCYWI
jgi:hypothetical protein